MPKRKATLLALFSASGEQHLFHFWMTGSRQNLIKTPITSKPAFFNKAAATEESIPPDMATITFDFLIAFIIKKIND